MFIKPKKRRSDKFGSGEFGASRGERKHNGQDFECEVESEVFSSVIGVVTKLGYPYGDDSSFRYVEIADEHDIRHRVFYIEPTVEVNDIILIGDVIGTTQKLGDRYKGINEHFHYEVLRYVHGKKKFLNPNKLKGEIL